ncbi:DUF2500 domain-containing protein [Aminipila butyrica]|uniref:DUF2500 domain-containing protein n=1 Tax=Aminipila butyrica TaxID=433296 RepID=A0A858BYU6_9FIRM|nr:DUF2500 domain-containing protein [Aminipila butyrica]QIB70070.1 DUF2500 domain-containing protein [Aminipila butyrica]
MISDVFFFGGGFEIVFFLIFILVLCIIVVNIVRGIGQWNKNNHSPRLTVAATVVAKRIDVSHGHHNNGGDITGAQGSYTTSSTSYYVTFQVESGDRIEFLIGGSEYGFLVEGDHGQLSFQGSRYLSFERSL